MTCRELICAMLRILLSLGTALLAARTARADPLACQPNEEQPMLPTFHIIGNVTKNADGSIKLEAINDCSGVTYSNGIYHVWHQCCQVCTSFLRGCAGRAAVRLT